MPVNPSSIRLLAACLVSTPVLAQTVHFDKDVDAAVSAGWTCGVTGRGSPRWSVEADPSAPSLPNVLKHSGSGNFTCCV